MRAKAGRIGGPIRVIQDRMRVILGQDARNYLPALGNGGYTRVLSRH